MESQWCFSSAGSYKQMNCLSLLIVQVRCQGAAELISLIVI